MLESAALQAAAEPEVPAAPDGSLNSWLMLTPLQVAATHAILSAHVESLSSRHLTIRSGPEPRTSNNNA